MLKGEKVVLRPVKEDDFQLFLNWFNNPDVLQYVAWYLPMTEMYERQWIANLSKPHSNKVVFVIVMPPGIPIGTCGLHSIDYHHQVATFGIVIGATAEQGKGYGYQAGKLLIKYAFEELNLHRLNSDVLDYNERSIKLHKKLGFIEEGRMRKCKFKKGKFHDLIVFGLLRSE